jgi:host factor-I protein
MPRPDKAKGRLELGLASLPAAPSNSHAGQQFGPVLRDESTGKNVCRRPRKYRGAGARGTKNGTTAMAADRAQNLQDTFLNHVRKNKIPLTIFLVNGVKLQGVVTWFDNFCVLLRRDGHSQLVYKHAISTIMPGHPVQLFEGAEEAPSGE